MPGANYQQRQHGDKVTWTSYGRTAFHYAGRMGLPRASSLLCFIFRVILWRILYYASGLAWILLVYEVWGAESSVALDSKSRPDPAGYINRSIHRFAVCPASWFVDTLGHSHTLPHLEPDGDLTCISVCCTPFCSRASFVRSI
jgi:hypothetical protein